MFNLKEPWRHWSLWLSGAGTAALGLLLCAPDQALQLWNFAVPAEVKSLLPGNGGVWVSWGLLFASIVAKFVRQKAVADRIRAALAGLYAWLLTMGKGGDNGRNH